MPQTRQNQRGEHQRGKRPPRPVAHGLILQIGKQEDAGQQEHDRDERQRAADPFLPPVMRPAVRASEPADPAKFGSLVHLDAPQRSSNKAQNRAVSTGAPIRTATDQRLLVSSSYPAPIS